MTKVQSYRMKQTERGNEALKMLARYFEKKEGLLTVSMKESCFSSGSYGQPDLIFGKDGVEVKRVEFMSRSHFKNGEEFRIKMGHMSLKHESWNYLKEWCKKTKKEPCLIIVLTWGRNQPIFVKFTKEQVNNMQRRQSNKKWIQISSWDALLKGEILT